MNDFIRIEPVAGGYIVEYPKNDTPDCWDVSRQVFIDLADVLDFVNLNLGRGVKDA